MSFYSHHCPSATVWAALIYCTWVFNVNDRWSDISSQGMAPGLLYSSELRDYTLQHFCIEMHCRNLLVQPRPTLIYTSASLMQQTTSTSTGLFYHPSWLIFSVHSSFSSLSLYSHCYCIVHLLILFSYLLCSGHLSMLHMVISTPSQFLLSSFFHTLVCPLIHGRKAKIKSLNSSSLSTWTVGTEAPNRRNLILFLTQSLFGFKHI